VDDADAFHLWFSLLVRSAVDRARIRQFPAGEAETGRLRLEELKSKCRRFQDETAILTSKSCSDGAEDAVAGAETGASRGR
jgi:hypothetical protein